MATPTKKNDTPEDFKTEQDKGAARDPISKAKEPEKVVTVEEQGIGPRDPYPTGNPPTPLTTAELHGYATPAVAETHGFKKAKEE